MPLPFTLSDPAFISITSGAELVFSPQLFTKVGSFTAPTGTGSKVVTGVGFAPKAIRFWGTNTAGETLVDGAVIFNGFTDGTNDAACSLRRRGTTTGGDRRSTGSNCIDIETEVGVQQYIADLTSLDSDGFTLNFSTVNDTSAWLIHYEAWGGDNVNAAVGWIDEADTSGVTGLSFQPTFLFLTHIFNGEATTSNNPKWGFGVCDAKMNQWGISGSYGNFGATTTQGAVLRTDGAFVGLSNGSLIGIITIDTFEADGFTFSETTGSITGGDGFYYLALGLPVASKVGTFAKSTGAAPATQNLPELGFTPQMYGLASAVQTSETLYNGDVQISAGAYDGTNVRNIAHSSENAVSDAQGIQNDSDVLQMLDSTGVVIASATASAITNPTPELTWNTNAGDGYTVGFYAFDSELSWNPEESAIIFDPAQPTATGLPINIGTGPALTLSATGSPVHNSTGGPDDAPYWQTTDLGANYYSTTTTDDINVDTATFWGITRIDSGVVVNDGIITWTGGLTASTMGGLRSSSGATYSPYFSTLAGNTGQVGTVSISDWFLWVAYDDGTDVTLYLDGATGTASNGSICADNGPFNSSTGTNTFVMGGYALNLSIFRSSTKHAWFGLSAGEVSVATIEAYVANRWPSVLLAT